MSLGRVLSSAMFGTVLFLGVAPRDVLAQAAKPQPPKPTGQASVAAPLATDAYKVAPGDLLQVVVWKEPELTRDALVRADGRITIPLVGDVEAAGHTPKQLAEEIAKGIGRFVTSPQVTVGVGQAVSSRVYVIGQVVRSGEITLTVPLTVVQALALSGGFKEFARTDSILVVGRDRTSRPFNYKKFEVGRDLDQNTVLQPGDTIVVP